MSDTVIHYARALEIFEAIFNSLDNWADTQSFEKAIEEAKEFVKEATRPLTPFEIESFEEAKDIHCTDECEIDEPLGPQDFSEGDTGVWVRAWVWVAKENKE